MYQSDPREYFEEVYKIYMESFPPVERRTREGQWLAMSDPSYRLLTIKENNEIIAFLGYWELSSCLFAEHLATTPASRGKGCGQKLVRAMQKEAKRLHLPIFLEIEPITPSNPFTARRAGFYKRLGFCLNEFPYEQMPLKPEDSPIPLCVMSYLSPISEQDFLPFKSEIYQVVYHVSL